MFADGYYNLGWWGVILVGVAVGAMLAWTSTFARTVFQQRALVWLPVAFIGSYMAYRIDGTFVNDFLGVFMFCLYLQVAGSLLAGGWSRGDRPA